VRVSVIVVSYNSRAYLPACLGSLARAAGSAEVDVIVADNASSDASAALVREQFPEARLIEMGANRGFGAAVNAAAKEARGDVFLLLNPDTELPADAIETLAARLDADPTSAALAPRQVDARGFFQLAVGPEPKLGWELVRRFVQRRLDRGSERVAKLIDNWLATPREVPWAAASCLLVRRADFERVRGFDEGFFLYFEDLDLCLRLRDGGRRVLYDPTLTVVHHRGASARTAPDLAARAYRDSQARFWKKHRGGLVGFAVGLYAAARRGA
jgi:N-acetylglucosaminyl-diphospho-decaprenol L-rhamnosyltransferase